MLINSERSGHLANQHSAPDDNGGGLNEACGLFAIQAPERDVARLTYFGLYALQHRGQESAGMAVGNDGYITTVRERGLVAQVFNERQLQALPGQAALGHVRYSTTGNGSWENAQPLWRNDHRPLAFAHNGNLINAAELRQELLNQQIALRGNSDSEIIAALLSGQEADNAIQAAERVFPRLRGAVSAAVLTPTELIAFRDPRGLRPLALGRLGDDWIIASESCAFDIIGAQFQRQVSPGEMLVIDNQGQLSSQQLVSAPRRAHCLFEHIYFARPDSVLSGQRVQSGRRRLGEMLWHRAPVAADLVIAVPDSGTPAARGLAAAAGLPQDDGLIKNRYVARTFIQPSQELRQRGLRMKFNPLPEIVAGQRLIVVDDSIVRGNTTKQIVAMLRQAGAAEIHLRISSPPVRYSCHYGVDISGEEEMFANRHDQQLWAQELGADSLAFLTLEDSYQALQLAADEHCDACFSGDYPLADD